MRIGPGVCSYRRPCGATKVCNAVLEEVAAHKLHHRGAWSITACKLGDDNFAGYEMMRNQVREKVGLRWVPKGCIAVEQFL
jgi:hypothetical protein